MKNIKKLLSLVLAGALLFTLAPFAAAAQDDAEYPECGIRFDSGYQPLVPGTLEVNDNFWESTEEQWILREEAETRTVESTGVSLWCDVNGDSSVNVDDAAELQKSIAQLITIPEETLAETSEINMDGVISVSDVTTLQRMLADFDLKQVTAGDVDRNGKLDENDIISFFKYFNYEEIKRDLSDATNIAAKNYIIKEYTEELNLDLARADFDGNGEVGVDDVYALINQFDTYHSRYLDVTQDNVLDGRDLNCIKEYLAGAMGSGSPMRTPKSVLIADVTEDGLVNIEDVHYFQKMFAGIGGFESPDTSWISKELIEKDRELQEHPQFSRSIPDKKQLTYGFYAAPNGITNRPYFYSGPGPFCSIDKYGAMSDYGAERFILNGYDTSKNHSKQNNIIIPVSIFGYEIGALEHGSDAYSRVSLLDGNYSGSYNNVFFFCKNVDCIKGQGFDQGKNFFAPNAGCYDPAISPNTTVQREFVSNMIASTFEHFVFPKNYTYLDSFQKSTGLKSFTDIFAPGVVRINKYCFKASQLNKIIIPARIQDISKQAFYVEKVTKKLNEFCDNNKKSYNIVFLSKSMPYDKDYFNKLDDSSYGHLCISVWPFKKDILVSGDHRTTANANVNVFAFGSSGVAQDLNWFYSESNCAPGHHKNSTNTTDYIYKPIYL